MAALFTTTIFLSALLLFSVQPLMARLLLPSLGGSPAVWNTAMVFFQAVLLGGYLYAHGLGLRLKVSRRVLIFHGAVLLLPLLFLPLALPPNLTPPATAQPIFWLLGVLLACVGAPFFVLSTSSPLLQRLFALTSHRDARDPYFLYAASNAGSLIALLAYPLALEPNLALSAQTRLWAGLYLAYLVCMGACLWVASRSNPTVANPEPIEAAETATAPLISPRRRARWVVLALVPSSLMLSVTTYLSSDVAAIPLLWIVPLSLYLASFMVVFARRPWVPPTIWARLLAILILPLVIALAARAGEPLVLLVPLHLGVFFLAALVCHGELARDRPDATHLTQFYGWMALGGVLGGAFNALVAPLIFSDVVEYPLFLVALCFLLPRDLLADDKQKAHSFTWNRGDLLWPLTIGAICFALVQTLQNGALISGPLEVGIIFGLPVFACFLFSRRPPRFALAVGAILWCGTFYRAGLASQFLDEQRSFFGIHRVLLSEDKRFVLLTHGGTTHSVQRAPEPPNQLHQLLPSGQPYRDEPLLYYSRQGPVGDVMRTVGSTHPNLKVAVVGLGAGTVAAYIRPHDHWDFYEIDPKVAQIAQDSRLFTYWQNAPAKPRLILGDARLQLKSATDGNYDVILLDAYSSDTVPVHLLTREALSLYKSKLAPNGVIIWHISNAHFDLEPVVGQLAKDAGLFGLTRKDDHLDPKLLAQHIAPSQWAVLAHKSTDIGWRTPPRHWKPLRTDAPLWSDEKSSLWSLLVRKWRE